MISLLENQVAKEDFLQTMRRENGALDQTAFSFILVHELKPGRQGQSLWAKINEQIDVDVLNWIGKFVVLNAI